MRYAVISDIHANEQALRAVLSDAEANGAESVICLGDVVGYGPMPCETVKLVRSSCAVVTAGNHDDAVSGRAGTEDFIGLASDAVARHREELSDDDTAWLRHLPYVYEGDGFIACHGDFTEPEKFYYVDESADAEANFAATGAELMFVGHTHQPQLFLTGASGKVYKTEAQDFTLEKGKRYIVNPGSTGYPRERGGKCLSSYVIYDSDQKTVTFHYVPLAISSVMQRGENPKIWGLTLKSLKRGIIIAAISAAAVFGVAGAFLFSRPTSATADESGLIVRELTIPIPRGAKTIRPNLTLMKGSDPVHLWITFIRSNGGEISQWSNIVKDRCLRKIKIPSDTAEARLSVKKTSAGDKPQVASLKPSTSP
jgi:predicted phosphodiesterase